MIGVLINPGSGPLSGVTLKHARRNMGQLLRDIRPRVPRVKVKRVPVRDGEGRYCFELRVGQRRCIVDMPGRPLEEVRDLDAPLPSIPPRLYIDGDSWYWYFAVGWIMRALGVDLDGAHDGGCPIQRGGVCPGCYMQRQARGPVKP